MKKTKVILIVMIIVILIIIILLGILLSINKKKIEEYGEELPKEITERVPEGLNPQDDPEMFYSVSNYIQSFLDYGSVNFATREDKTLEEKSKMFLDILNENYKKKNNLDSNNITEYMYKGENRLTFYPLHMKQLIEDNIFINVVYGLIEDYETGAYIQDAYYIVRLDVDSYAVDVEPVNNVKSIDEVQISKDTKVIKVNDYNQYVSVAMNVPNLINRYMANYIKLSKDYPELAYNYLDKEYREKRYGSLEEFKQEVEKQSSEEIIMKSYKVEQEEGYRRIVCLDEKGKYYIINETSTMEYTLIMDTYTITIPEFLEKYNKANAGEKVVLNIDRFMKALNDKNYKFAYSVLADSFKERNFKTLADFENYAKANFYENNKFSYEKFGNEADMYYTYEVKVSNQGAENIEKTKTFIVLLNDGTDFELSFNLD